MWLNYVVSKFCFNNHNQEKNALSLLHIVWILVWRKSRFFFSACSSSINVTLFLVSFICGFEFEHLNSNKWCILSISVNNCDKLAPARIKFWNSETLQMNLHFSKRGLGKKVWIDDWKPNRMKTWRKMSGFVWKLIDYGLNFQQLQS